MSYTVKRTPEGIFINRKKIETIDNLLDALGIKSRVSEKQFDNFEPVSYGLAVITYSSLNFLHLARKSTRYDAKLAGMKEPLNYLIRLIRFREKKPNGGSSEKLEKMKSVKENLEHQLKTIKGKEKYYLRSTVCYRYAK